MTPRWLNRRPDQPALAQDADWVEHEEGAISQPHQWLGLEPADVQRKVRVPDHLGDAPRQKHGRIEWITRQLGEGIDDEPDKEES